MGAKWLLELKDTRLTGRDTLLIRRERKGTQGSDTGGFGLLMGGLVQVFGFCNIGPIGYTGFINNLWLGADCFEDLSIYFFALGTQRFDCF
jgi:hypothetical protein